jgi:Tfp pilus assembly protein PilX
MNKCRKKGIVLIIVLATFFIVVLLANVILALISSQSRLTHHGVSRIQAYYAAMAGINLAYENLRTGAWTIPGSGSNTWTMCSGCSGSGFIDEPNLPGSINNVVIKVTTAGGTCSPPSADIPACITAAVDYSYL